MQEVKLTIVFLSDDFPPQSYGGAGIIAYNDAQSLAALGHKVHVVTRTSKKEQEGESQFEGLTLYKIYSEYNPRFRAYVSVSNRKVVKKVEAILASVKPDVVHAHNIHEYLSYSVLPIAKQYAKAVFLTAHDVMSFHYGKIDRARRVSFLEALRQNRFRFNPLRNVLIRKKLASVDRIFAVSDALKEALVMNSIENVETLRNGIDEKVWAAGESERDAVRAKYGLENKKVVLLGGRMTAAKGADKTLEAFGVLSKNMSDARLLMVGTFNENRLQNVAPEVRQKIVSTGWVDRKAMPGIYAAADVVSVASLYLDPFPTINLEAMAAGKPVVGTKFGGTPEAINDGLNGVIVDPNDTHALAAAISGLLSDEKRAGQMGVEGKKRAAEEFSQTAHIQRLLACYNFRL